MTEIIDATSDEQVRAAAQAAPAVELDEPIGSATPAPEAVVEGILCEKGHFNHACQPFCVRCGQALVDSRHRRARQARPALGTLTRDDGAVFVLDRDYMIVDEHSFITRSPSTGTIVLASPARRRIQIEVRVHGWDVVVIEHGSEVAVSLEPPAPDRMVPLCIPAVGLRRHLRPFQRFCACVTRANPAWARWATLPPVALLPDKPRTLPASWTIHVGQRTLLFESPFVGLRGE